MISWQNDIMKMAGKHNGISLRKRLMAQARGIMKHCGNFIRIFRTVYCIY